MTETKGFLDCSRCKTLLAGETCRSGIDIWGEGGALRLENNPAVWGAERASVYLLGFSKGGTQNQELLKVRADRANFEDIPFKGMRHRLQWLMEALGLLQDKKIESIFSGDEQRIQSASLVRCSLSADTGAGKYSYKMKDILDADELLLRQVAENCVRQHLGNAKPGSLFILLGLDPKYIKLCQQVMSHVFGSVAPITATTYRAGCMWVAHAAHPSSNQTDPQYKRWVSGETKKAKVVWARNLVEESGAVAG
jgi:hypothetical protein